MTTITATTILRSRNTTAPDKVLSTLLCRYPRFIHAEVMTHRVFSRNAASSRAIPVSKLIEDVLNDPAKPLHWGKNQSGMQAHEELAKADKQKAKLAWNKAWVSAVEHAEIMATSGAHKQLVNRILEPFAHITVLISATEWDGFLELRDHADAEPHMQMLAKAIRQELDHTDNIQDLSPGEWHLPFTTEADGDLEARRILSIARCASTSYKTTDGFDMTQDRAERLYSKLFSTPFHSSPFEHQAQADEWDDGCIGDFVHSHEHGNFVGFRQLRKQLEAAL